ncbi:MAG: U32 family peptidase [Solobacterium sp.]|nr:U32 family peptidase [Solobacterium sp.]
MGKLIISVNTKEMILKSYEMGADEVVISLNQCSFNGLKKISLEELDSNIPVSIFFNCCIFPEQIDEYHSLFEKIQSLKIQSIYFQDPIIILWAREFNCLEKCIYRPETLVTNQMDANWWYSRGLKSVSISPLITLEETLHMIRNVPNSECVIHGHLMMSYSKRYLVSAFTNHNDLPSLRNNYDLTIQEEKRDGHMPIYEDENGTLIYTDFVLESFNELPILMKKGISRVFVNGEFLKDEELLDALSIYKQIMEEKDVQNQIVSFFEKYKETSYSKGYYEEKTIQ